MMQQKYTISDHQRVGLQRGLYKHETLVIPSTTVPSLGSYFIIDFKHKQVLINQLRLEFNITSNMILVPAFFFITYIEVTVNNTIIDTLYADSLFLYTQYHETDQNRQAINVSAGPYNNDTQLGNFWGNNSGTSVTKNVYLNLKSFFEQSGYNLLNQNHEVQLRVYMASNITSPDNKDSPGYTPSVVINSCNLIAKVTRIEKTAQMELVQLSKMPKHHLFHSTQRMTQVVQSGVSTTTVVLSALTGNIMQLFFIVRPTSTALTNPFTFTQIKNFAILDAGGSNVIGGQVELEERNRWQKPFEWANNSTFTLEPELDINASYVYCWSFSANTRHAIKTANHYGSHKFMGNEQLQIIFTSALGSSQQIDIFALVESSLVQKIDRVDKINL